MNIPALGKLIDERFLNHRLRSTGLTTHTRRQETKLIRDVTWIAPLSADNEYA